MAAMTEKMPMTPKQVEEATELLQRHADLKAADVRLAATPRAAEVQVIVGRRTGADGSIIEDEGARFRVHARHIVAMIAASIRDVEDQLTALGIETEPPRFSDDDLEEEPSSLPRPHRRLFP
jgi:hypothetical protein